MNLLKIKIEDKHFVDITCEEDLIVKVKPRHVVANGWDCRIFGNGKIYCETEENYSDGRHFMKFVINPNGGYQIKLRRPNEETITLKKGFVKGEISSVKQICLSDGYLDDRQAYFVQN